MVFGLTRSPTKTAKEIKFIQSQQKLKQESGTFDEDDVDENADEVLYILKPKALQDYFVVSVSNKVF